ncbi:MAG: glycosyltransferase family 4 protein [Acidobacteriota bacterium]
MKIFYIASDIDLDRGHGGATHVLEVAENLAALGHEVTVFARGRRHAPGNPAYHPMPRHLPRCLRLLNAFAIRRSSGTLRPDVIIERYYQFGGEGAWLARRTKVPLVLEANAPMIEYPGSPKQWIDSILLINPLESYRLWQARQAALIVTPLPSIIPPSVPPARIQKLPWGVNCERFRTRGARAETRCRLGIPSDAPVALFAGSFRKWHGAEILVKTACGMMWDPSIRLRVLLVGDGPALPSIKRTISAGGCADRFILAGRIPYEQMPQVMEAADFAVAPFDTKAHPYLSLGFYWSPLKVFEAMAMGLPVVTIRRAELEEIVGDAGRYYAEGDREALTGTLVEMCHNTALRAQLGAAARSRARQFSWRGHCQALSERLESVLDEHRRTQALSGWT